MTKMKQYTEAMHSRLGKVANREQFLIQALGEALGRADQRLLDDVRNLTVEHETRRVLILTELQALASRIGAFPASKEQIEMLQDESLDLPYYAPDEEPIPAPEPEVPNGADWREATKNIHEELNRPIEGLNIQVNGVRTVS